MAPRSRSAVLLALLALGAGATSFYTGCVAYRAASWALFANLTHGGIVAHLMGGDGGTLIGLGQLGELAFAATGWMKAVGAAAGLGAALLVLLRGRSLATPRGTAAGFAALGLAAAAALGVDLRYGFTPWSDVVLRGRGLLARGVAVEHDLTVEEVQTLPDALSGSVARVGGVLAYSESMKRFQLESLETPGRYVKVFFHLGRRSGLSELTAGGAPRHAEEVLPLVGERVVLVGRVVNGQIDVELSDVALAP